MSRGIGEFGPIQEFVPAWTAVLLGLLTQLGDVWFLSLVVVIVYWFRPGRRDDVAVVAGTTLAGFALVDALKRIFALPRPDRPLVQPEALAPIVRPLYEATGTAGGYGFPSGHAFMTTIVYLSLVDVFSVGTRRHRLAGAAALIAVVCFTRVALGVHYLVDVVAGVGFGLLVLLLARTLTASRAGDPPTAAFALALVASGLNLLPANRDLPAVLLFGATLGAFGGWQLVVCGRRLVAADRPSAAVRPMLRRATLAAAAFAPIVAVLDGLPLDSTYGRSAVLGLATGLVVTVPVLGHSERASRLRTAIAFWATAAWAAALRFLSGSSER